MKETESVDKNVINHFSFNQSQNPLIDRIFDQGIGLKFNEFSNENKKKKGDITKFNYIAESLNNDPNYITNNLCEQNRNNGKTMNPKNRPMNYLNELSEKINLFAGKLELEDELKEKKNKKEQFQEINSKSGFKMMSKLPPSRGNKYHSLNPIERNTFLSKEDRENDQLSQYLNPKLSRPTPTIISLTKNQSEYLINTSTKVSNLTKENQEKLSQKNPEIIAKNSNKIQIIKQNNIEQNIEKENKDLDEDIYIDKINKFIKQAFEGKDYRINFVYYLPSKNENFYDLEPSTFEQINNKPIYYTLSAKGLTVYVNKKPKEFIKLSEWIIEKQGYNFVSSIDFFMNFKFWRILKNWRQNIFKQKKIAYQNELANTLLFNNPNYNERICDHKSLCNKIENSLKIIDLKVTLESNHFSNFLRRQFDAREKIKKLLYEVQEKCDRIFVNGVKKIFNEVQRKINAQNNEANFNEEDLNKNKIMKGVFKSDISLNDNDDEEILNDDNIVGFENYPYKFKMMIKTECINFIKLAYLFDYIMLDVLRRAYINSMKEILQILDEFNKMSGPSTLKENSLNSHHEYVKPSQSSQNKRIPYFLINCKLDNKSIEKRDKIRQKVKEFFVKSTPDDEFDPTAHIKKDPEEEEISNLINKRSTINTTNRNSDEVKDKEDTKSNSTNAEVEVEVIERAHHYFISYDPQQHDLISSFKQQIEEAVKELKVKGWKAHPVFKKYIGYLENWDDRFGDWDNDEPIELDPEHILIQSEDPLFRDREAIIEKALKLAYNKCTQYLTKMNPYLQLHWKQKSINKEFLLLEYVKDVDEVYRLLFYFTEKNIKTLQRYIPYEEDIGMIKLSFEENLRKDLISEQNSTINYLKPKMPNLIRDRANVIEKWIDEMNKNIEGNIDSEKDYLHKTKAKDTLDQLFYIYERKLNTLDTIVNLLKNKGFEITNEDLKNIENINKNKFKLKLSWDELNENLSRNKDKLKSKNKNSSIPSLLKEANHINNFISDEKFINYNRETQQSLIPAYIAELEEFENKYKNIEKNKNIYIDFLKIISEKDHDFIEIEKIHEKLLTLKNLWISLKDFDEESDEWKKTKILEFDDDSIDCILKKINSFYDYGKMAEAQIGNEGSAIQELINNAINFKESIEVIRDLKSAHLNDNHWSRIQQEFPNVDFNFKDKEYSLKNLLEIKVYEKQKKISEIAQEAYHYKDLKEKIKEINELRKEIKFKTENYKDNYKKIDEIDKVVENIEKCQLKLNIVLSSLYVRLLITPRDNIEGSTKMNIYNKDDPFVMKADFDGCLMMIEDLKTFQKKWMYLENIMSSDVTSKSIPDNQFDKVDLEWKNYLQKVSNEPSVLSVYSRYKKTDINKEDFFQKNIKKLDEAHKKIEDWLLTSKRKNFSRFYFISTDDLLNMFSISNSSQIVNSINALKPYLSKLFEDVSDLIITQSNTSLDVHGLISSSKEELHFEKSYDKRSVKINEKIDIWVSMFESNMLVTLKEKINYGLGKMEMIKDITKDIIQIHEAFLEKITVKKDNSEYITSNVSQVIYYLTQFYFCTNTESAINDQHLDSNSLKRWYEKIDLIIKMYTKMVNKDTYTRQMKRIISNLIIHYIQFLSICEDLCKEEPQDENEFVWQKQLRAGIELESNSNYVIYFKQLKYTINYGYEFIGNSSRAVITPLTDRVLFSITNALNNHLGCSLNGNPGTGKSETVKDLAKTLGIQCIVFDCSEQVDYKIIGNILSGLYKHSQGIFACFNDYNKLKLEVLSVIATQIFNIQQALLTNETNIIILNEEISINDKICVGMFVTFNICNSDYIPDSLKSPFRPISMLIPDFLNIAEVKLKAEGFLNSKSLAKKLINLYSLTEQLLSRQHHYCFTLRTVSKVLNIAGNKKNKLNRVMNTRDEDLILLSAIKEANIPMLIFEDIQIFNLILNSLFSECESEFESTPNEFKTELVNVINQENFNENKFTIQKCVQIHDVLKIRSGICLVGPAGSGKSTCIQLVEKTLTYLHQINPSNKEYREVQTKTINPKAITLGELFGQQNENNAFIAGLATRKIKKALSIKPEDEDSCYRWVCFDGPIEMNWIENMNSGFDDSATLCLSNGERIKLKPHLKLFFEVEDLANASLGLISRLGIIHFNSNDLGWRPYVYTWIKRVYPDELILTNEMKQFLLQLFEDKIDDSIENLYDLEKNNCVFIKPVLIQCIWSLCNYLEMYITSENKFQGKDNLADTPSIKRKIVYVFAFCLIWGVFGCVNNKGSHKVDAFVRNKFIEIQIEKSQLIMEHYFDFTKNEYVKYSESNNYFKYESGVSYYSLFVPTIDTLRYSIIIESLIKRKKNIFLSGESGVGKTALVNNIINKLIKSEDYSNIQMNLSAVTSSEDLQKSLEGKLVPRRGRNCMSGKPGKKLTIFIDDVNMPESNEWGSHPPIELLRQYLDKGGFYDRSKFFWKYIEDASLIIAGCPQKSSKNKLTNRFIRHFHLICLPVSNKNVLTTIFESILKGFLQANTFHESIKKNIIETTISTLEVFEFISEQLKPIPGDKYHYKFNLRDVSKVFQGLLMIDPNHFHESNKFTRLWIHEIMRVFGDRLVNESDLKILQDNIVFVVKNKFKMLDCTYEKIFKNNIYFGEIMMHETEAITRPYDEITSDITKTLEYYQTNYNKTSPNNFIQLAFFEYAVMHILRITRILRQPQGNMMLIGNCGSGKQTLTKFSCFTMNFSHRSFQSNNYRSELKEIIKDAGINRKSTVLLLTDINVTNNSILEDINNLLNNSEIPNLYESDLPGLLNNLSEYARGEVNTNLYETFVKFTKENLHVIFCTSPGENLRLRLRKFPGFIKNCTLNWFMPWPQEALVSCSRLFYKQFDSNDSTKDQIIQLSLSAYLEVLELSERYFTELSRKVYITPKSFLDSALLFVEIYNRKKIEIDTTIRKLEEGVKKFEKTHLDVTKVEEKLSIIEIEIAEKNSLSNLKKEKVNQQTVEVIEQRSIIQERSSHVATLTANLDNIKRKIEYEKNEIDKELIEIIDRITFFLTKEKINDLFKTKNAQRGNKIFVTFIEATVYVLKHKKITSLEELLKIMLNERERILHIRQEIDEGKITENVMIEFKNYVNILIPKVIENLVTEGKTYEEVYEKNVNESLKALHEWDKGVIKYWELNYKHQPLKEKVFEKEKELEETERELERSRLEFKELQEKSQKINEELNEVTKNIEDLSKEKEKNYRRKNNAGKLVALMSTQGDQWKEEYKLLNSKMNDFLGNMFLSALSISYLPPFGGSYRDQLVDKWKYLCVSNDISVSRDFSLNTSMSDPVTLREWIISGLPSDTISIENGIMCFCNPKFPLMIDPQLQANKWLKKIYKNKLSLIKADVNDSSDVNSQMEIITKDIKQGNICLVEDIDDKIDCVYIPILSRMTIDDVVSSLYIEYNSQKIAFDTGFKIFFTTKLSNPHFTSEHFIKLNIINFTITLEGLSEQLLNEIFKIEHRDKYEHRNEKTESIGKFNLDLTNSEKEILQKLVDANEDNILDDEELIKTIQNAKKVSDDVQKKILENILVEKEISLIKNEYIPVANRGSIIYFVIMDLAVIDSMYLFSLDFYKKLIDKAINKSPKSNDIKNRVNILEKAITEDIFNNIKIGLLESHKTIFSFLIAIYIKRISKQIEDEEWNLFIKGPLNIDTTVINPDIEYFSHVQWQTLLCIETRFNLMGLSQFVIHNLEEFKMFFEKIQEYNEFETEFPGGDNSKTTFPNIYGNNFLKLLLLKIFRPDKLLSFIRKYIIIELGHSFIDSSPTKLEEIYLDSDEKTPIIYIINKGSDPTNEIVELNYHKFLPNNLEKKNYYNISLGQEHGEEAHRAIISAIQTGTWVILQNCHLFTSTMKNLAKIINDIHNDTIGLEVDKNFRLFLTSKSFKDFPVSLLQNSLKLISEPPSNIKGDMKLIFNSKKLTVNEYMKKDIYPKLLYSLSLFHAVIQQRKKFGSIGFNLLYDFTQADFDISKNIIKIFLDESEDIPWNSITFTIGEVIYGGRITNELDRITMITTLKKFLTENLAEREKDQNGNEIQNSPYMIFSYSKCNKYFSPSYSDIGDYEKIIDGLPLKDEPDLFGLDENVNRKCEIEESNKIQNLLLNVVPKENSKSSNKILLETVNNLLMSKPEIIDITGQRHKSHDKIQDYNMRNSLSIVLYQEIEKYNNLIFMITNSLEEIPKILQGQILITTECDEIINSLQVNRVPKSWSELSYISNKPLASWFSELINRVNFIQNWLVEGPPDSFWINGFFYPKTFITAVLINHARETKVSVSDITFRNSVLDKYENEIMKGPNVGVYIHGLYLDGASYDIKRGMIVNQKPDEKMFKMPIIWLETIKDDLNKKENIDEDEDEEEDENKIYYFNCNVFKTLKRSSDSDDPIISINLLSREISDYWILKGTALVSQLDN